MRFVGRAGRAWTGARVNNRMCKIACWSGPFYASMYARALGDWCSKLRFSLSLCMPGETIRMRAGAAGGRRNRKRNLSGEAHATALQPTPDPTLNPRP